MTIVYDNTCPFDEGVELCKWNYKSKKPCPYKYDVQCLNHDKEAEDKRIKQGE